jgi:4-amino-4-deoxy-L-arabinose transferase-like glycosyltransferase
MTQIDSGPLPRHHRPWLFVLLAVHAAILAWAAHGPLTRPLNGFRINEFYAVALITLVVAAISFAWAGHRARAWAAAGTLVAAAIILGPGPVAIVLLGLLNAHVVGGLILRQAAPSAQATISALPAGIVVLVGMCAWIGVLAVTAPLKVHYAPVYAAGLLLPLVWAHDVTRATIARLAAALAPPAHAPDATERGWLALLQMAIVIHLFLVARPEVAYDANAMHLHVALLMESQHRFAFDVTRYAWAVMPLGADWAYAAAYMLGGETSARLANLCYGALACHLVYALVRRHARPELALASVALLASTPLAFIETGALYIENLWAAYLLGALFVTIELRATDTARPALWVVLAWLAAGAMQSKVIGALWLGPLFAYALATGKPRAAWRATDMRMWCALALAVLIAILPYANAWLRTGNPVFPFMNHLFGSPLFERAIAFTNPLYVAPLRPWSLYDTIVSSGKFIEGNDGAAGLHWLLLLPLIYIAFARKRPPGQWAVATLAIVFFVAVFTQQAYLRYLLPAFLLLAVLGGWAANDLGERRPARVAMLVVGGFLCLLHVRLIPMGAWDNAVLCLRCGFDAKAREDHIATYMPGRLVARYLNRELPDARVGFFLLNGPAPNDYMGYSRSGNWHDIPVFDPLRFAQSADDVAAIARRFGLTHAVFRTRAPEQMSPAITAFRERDTVPAWTFQDFIVARIKPPG